MFLIEIEHSENFTAKTSNETEGFGTNQKELQFFPVIIVNVESFTE